MFNFLITVYLMNKWQVKRSVNHNYHININGKLIVCQVGRNGDDNESHPNQIHGYDEV